jgi:CheY-like chemotaxis protein
MNAEHPDQLPIQKHILVVEDNVMSQKMIEFFLKELGFAFKICGNGHDGVEQARREKFDLVFMDLELPLLNGYEATHKLRYDLKLNIPIIAMTAHDNPAERQKCLAAGMNDYIGKPVEREKLTEIIKRYL